MQRPKEDLSLINKSLKEDKAFEIPKLVVAERSSSYIIFKIEFEDEDVEHADYENFEL